MDNETKERFRGVNMFLTRSGPLGKSDFQPESQLLETLRAVPILVVGAGGLGCELLKDLALMGFQNLSVIDMDTIDLSNLNRQFLFRHSDIGRPKAEVAANFIMKRVPQCKVTSYCNRIEDKPPEFYKQFWVVVCGLDSISARQWLNGTLFSLVQWVRDASGATVPASGVLQPVLVDGGTEGFKGNVRVTRLGLNACIECAMDLYPPPVSYPMCTLANTPRKPEHCVEYVRQKEWPQEKPFDGAPLDTDSLEHMEWIRERAERRARSFGIAGPGARGEMTLQFTQGVVKHIIPTVASTNAVVAALCALEVFKLISGVYSELDNFLNMTDFDGISNSTVSLEKKEDCLVCSHKPVELPMPGDCTVQNLLDYLTSRALDGCSEPFANPMVVAQTAAGDNKTLRMPLFDLNHLLPEQLASLGLESGSSVTVTEKGRQVRFVLSLNLSSGTPKDE